MEILGQFHKGLVDQIQFIFGAMRQRREGLY